MQKNKYINKLDSITIERLLHCLGGIIHPSSTQLHCVRPFMKQINLGINTRGIKDTCSRIKFIRLHVLRYLSGNPLLICDGYSLKLNKLGLPVSLGKLQKLVLRGSHEDLRFVLTCLSVSRILNFATSPDIDPIVTVSSCSPFGEGMLNAIVSDLNFKISPPSGSDPHFSQRSGPNGHATRTSVDDLKALPKDLISDIKTLGGSEITSYIRDLSGLSEEINNRLFRERVNNVSFRKLSFINCPEGKTRVIAILDYWSQTVLKPYHEKIFSLLKEIKSDCTFNQGSHLTLSSATEYGSIDLKNATDRFPIGLQTKVFEFVFGDENKAKAWERILIAHPYKVPWLNRSVKYGAGQPMGAYTSWAMFALTHHVVIRGSAINAGLTSDFDCYILLGDDVVIGNPLVANEYLKLMNQFGVEVSLAKTFISKDMYEFAKKTYIKGVEVSGAQIKAFSVANGSLLTEEYLNLVSRSQTLPNYGALTPRAVIPFLASHRITRSYKKAYEYMTIPRMTDNDELRLGKVMNFSKLFLHQNLTCNHSIQTLNSKMFRLLYEMKIDVLGESIKALHKSYINLTRLINETMEEVFDDSGMNSILVQEIHPLTTCIHIKMSTIGDNGNKYKLAKTLESYEEFTLQETPPDLVDPCKIGSKRVHEQMIISRVTLSRKCSKGSKDYTQLMKGISSTNVTIPSHYSKVTIL